MLESNSSSESKSVGTRVSGKDWKIKHDPFRIKKVSVPKFNSWEKRKQSQLKDFQVKSKIKMLKDEKKQEKDKRIAERKSRLEAKEEKERQERLSLKLSAKRAERKRRKEKRNKMLKER